MTLLKKYEMVYFNYGGKHGTKISLKEAGDLVAIRYSEEFIRVQQTLNDQSRSIMSSLIPVESFPESNVSIYKCNPINNMSGKQMRNLARKTLSKEENVRFAGRVLLDPNGMINLYTENLFIQFNSELKIGECRELIKSYELEVKRKLKFAKNAFFVQGKEGIGLDIFKISNELIDSKKVKYCHPEIIKKKSKKSINSNQWHLAQTTYNGINVDAHVNISGAWVHTKGEGVTIAIIDDSVDIDHPEFNTPGKIIAPIDMMSGIEDPRPKNQYEKHGTACAGVACAAGIGEASGIAPNAQIIPIKLNANLGSIAEAEAFEWAANNGANVISCSWGPPDGIWYDSNDPNHTKFVGLPDSTRIAIDYAVEQGCIITWAAGNGRESTSFDGYASYENVIAVSACNDTNTLSVYSDFGREVFCCFPSNDFGFPLFNHPDPITLGIWTTDNIGASGYSFNDYTNNFGGTSSACPGVAGVIALMLSVRPDLSLFDVKEIIKVSCDKIDFDNGAYDLNGHSVYYGYGRINARLAVENSMSY